MSIRLAYDAGPGIGLGHQRRMEALAAALRVLAIEPEIAPLEPRVDGDVVVVDSYRVRADGDAVAASRVAAVDDLARDLAVDLLVEPAPGGDAVTPEPRAARVLRGLRYALIDPHLADRGPAPVSATVTSVLVATGGTDAAGLGARMAADVLAALGVDVHLVVGPWSSSSVPEGVKPVEAPVGLAAELEAADLVVCAAGVTLLEALALGRPVVAVVTAANQQAYSDGLVAAGAVAGATVETAGAVAADLAGRAGERRRLADAGRQAVDGRGAARVAEAVVELV